MKTLRDILEILYCEAKINYKNPSVWGKAHMEGAISEIQKLVLTEEDIIAIIQSQAFLRINKLAQAIHKAQSERLK